MLLAMKPYGAVGIGFIIISILIAILSFQIGKNTRGQHRKYNLIMFIIGLIFVVLEVLHEVDMYIYLGSYDWSSFPFQFCTTTLYLCLLLPLFKQGKNRRAILMFFSTFTFLSGILPIVFAQGNLFRWPTMHQILFSFFWHLLLFFAGGFSIGYLNVGLSFKRDRRMLFDSIGLFVLLTCVAQLLNFLIHTFGPGWETDVIKEVGWVENYMLDPDSASLFYISPYFRSNIGIIFADVWLKYGWFLNWILYDLIFIFGCFVVYTTTYVIRIIINKIRLIYYNHNGIY